MLSIFSSVWKDICPFGHLYVFFGQISVRSSTHYLIELFGFLLLSYMSCLYWYILESNSLWVALFTIFSPILWVVFSFCLWVIIIFFLQKLLIRSHLFIFVFIFITLGHGSKRSCCSLCQRVFCLCFPQRVL